jgi:AcrR family transcriptional regulator
MYDAIMAEEGRRERKKLQTRKLIVTTAIRLFLDQGYEQTTIAQITAEADVAKKTFFNHFPSKEDVLFADVEQYYYDATLQVIAERKPKESIPDLLLRIYELGVARELAVNSPFHDADADTVKRLNELITSLPALQAKSLQVWFDLVRRIAEALTDAYPDELDDVTAAAAVGAMMGAAQGAVQAAGLARMGTGRSNDEYLAAARRGIDLVMRGLRTL